MWSITCSRRSRPATWRCWPTGSTPPPRSCRRSRCFEAANDTETPRTEPPALRSVFRGWERSRHALSPTATLWQDGTPPGAVGEREGVRGSDVSGERRPLPPSLSPAQREWVEVLLHSERGGEGV